jgi:carbon storage regulator
MRLKMDKTEARTMLILKRRIDESIYIGNDIQVSILDVFKNTITLGIAAPKEVLILRNELMEKNHTNRAQIAR